MLTMPAVKTVNYQVTMWHVKETGSVLCSYQYTCPLKATQKSLATVLLIEGIASYTIRECQCDNGRVGVKATGEWTTAKKYQRSTRGKRGVKNETHDRPIGRSAHLHVAVGVLADMQMGQLVNREHTLDTGYPGEHPCR